MVALVATFYHPIPRCFGVPDPRSVERLDRESFKELFLRCKRQLRCCLASKTPGALILSHVRAPRDVSQEAMVAMVTRGACVHKANAVFIFVEPMEAVKSRLEPIALLGLFPRGCALGLFRHVILFGRAQQLAHDIDVRACFALLAGQSDLVLWHLELRGGQPLPKSGSLQLRGQVIGFKRCRRCVRAMWPTSWRNRLTKGEENMVCVRAGLHALRTASPAADQFPGRVLPASLCLLGLPSRWCS